MALTVGTDLVSITDAESTTGWVGIGTGGGLALEPDFSAQGNNCISRAVSGVGAEKGMWYDITSTASVLDFSVGGVDRGKLIYFWIRCSTPGLIQTIQNGGLSIWIGTTTSDYHEYYVGGSDFGIPDSDGWILYLIDPTKGPSLIGGSGLTLSSVRYFGATIQTTATAKGQNLGIDRISYGKGAITGSGTSTSGLGFSDFADWDWADKNRRYGLVQIKNGIIFARCKFIIGDATGSVATTFTSNNETIVWETPMYMSGTQRVKSIEDTDVSGSFYWGIEGVGNGTGDTDITFGTVVGTDQGRSGNSFSVASNDDITSGSDIQPWKMIGTDGSVENFDIYGSSFKDLTATSPTNAFDLNGLTATSDNFSNFYDGCGRIDFGAMEVRNVTILNSVTSASDGAVIWDSDTDLQDSSFINNNRAIVFEGTTGSPFTFTNITFSPTTNAIRNESGGAITINIDGGSTPTAEDVGSSTTTIASSVPLSIIGVTEGTRCSMIASSGSLLGQELLFGYANVNGEVTTAFTGSTPQPVVVKARNSGIVSAAIQYDDNITTFTDYTIEARNKSGTNDVAVFPATPAVGDIFYVGGLAQFGEMEIDVSSPSTLNVLQWEYWDSSTWSSLTVTDPSTSFTVGGWHKIVFTKPSNWAATTVNSQGPYYYVRARITTAGGTQPLLEEITLNKTTKYLPFDLVSSIGTSGLSITAVWVQDTNAR